MNPNGQQQQPVDWQSVAMSLAGQVAQLVLDLAIRDAMLSAARQEAVSDQPAEGMVAAAKEA